MIDIKQTTTKNNNEITYDKDYLDLISKFLTEHINKLREEIKLKSQYKADEIRSRYQVKYMISKIIEDIESDLETTKKEKAFDINNYYDNLFGMPQDKEKKRLEDMIYDKKVERSGQYLYIFTYIFDNCFNGVNNVKSLVPEK